MQKYLPCLMYYGSALLFTPKVHCLQTHECTLGQAFVKFHIHIYEILRETWKRHLISWVSCCLQTCNSVVHMLVMWLVLGPSYLSWVSCYILDAKVFTHYNVL